MEVIERRSAGKGMTVAQLNGAVSKLYNLVESLAVRQQNGKIQSRTSQKMGKQGKGKATKSPQRAGQMFPPGRAPAVMAGMRSLNMNVEGTRGVFSDTSSISNTSAGNAAYYYVCGFNTTTGSQSFLQLLPEANQIAGIYRQFVINSLKFRFIPYISTSNSGQIALGVDPEPFAGSPTGIGSVARHRGHLFCGLNEGEVSGNYSQAWELSPPKKIGLATGRTEDDYSVGVLQIYSFNSLATSVVIGSMEVTLDVTFLGRK